MWCAGSLWNLRGGGGALDEFRGLAEGRFLSCRRCAEGASVYFIEHLGRGARYRSEHLM